MVVPWTTITTVVTTIATTTDYVTATSTLIGVSTASATITQTETDVVITSVTTTVLDTVSVSETVTLDVTTTTVFDRTATTFETVTNTATKTRSTDVCAPAATVWNLRVSRGTYDGQYLTVMSGNPVSTLTFTTTSPATFSIDSSNRVKVPSFGPSEFWTWASSTESSVVAVGTTSQFSSNMYPPPKTICSVSASTGEFTCAGFRFGWESPRNLLTVTVGTPSPSGMRLFAVCK